MPSTMAPTIGDGCRGDQVKAGRYTVQVDARSGYPASGTIYEAESLLTADHAVEREEKIRVGLADGRRLAARLLGRDPGGDLALLAVEEALESAAQPAASEPEVGELVLSLARPTGAGDGFLRTQPRHITSRRGSPGLGRPLR
jgi:S1-C subfamily serine protease